MAPAAQMLTRPKLASRLVISFASVVTMRPPVAAHGWPIAIELPLTLTLSQSMALVAFPFHPCSQAAAAQVVVHHVTVRDDRPLIVAQDPMAILFRLRRHHPIDNHLRRRESPHATSRLGFLPKKRPSRLVRMEYGGGQSTLLEVLTVRGLIRYFVLFVIDLETRRVEIAGIVHQPYEDWMKQIARNLTDAIDGFLRTTRFLIHDRDPLFSASFRATLSPAGVETVKLPARSPNLNAHAERFVRSIKHECLNRIVPLGENHLRTAVRAYVAHYHLERNHQGLDNRLISELPDSPGNEGSIQCRERLGGILRYYYREAA